MLIGIIRVRVVGNDLFEAVTVAVRAEERRGDGCGGGGGGWRRGDVAVATMAAVG